MILMRQAMLIAATIVLLALPSQARTWRDVTGTYSVEADLVDITDEWVVLKKTDGESVNVPIARLSRSDQRYVEQILAEQSRDKGVRFENPQTMTVRLGVKVTAQSPVSNLMIKFPIPMDWPEQSVTIIDVDKSPGVREAKLRNIDDGARQAGFSLGRLPAGESAQLIYTLEIERHQILPPKDTSLFRFAEKLDSDLRQYLAESPYIEIHQPLVRRAADELQLDESQSAWEQVESIYDWTRSRLEHGGTRPMKGALAALQTGTGDCEEYTSLFVAMCRLKGIPARCVWVTGHTYPEFYLEDDNGVGHWIPCEALGERSFGAMPRYDVIMQKGDNFYNSQQRQYMRYVVTTQSGSVPRGGQGPIVVELRERLD